MQPGSAGKIVLLPERCAMDLLINVDVPDVSRAIEFYRDALGLTLVRRLFDGSVAELAGASARIFLLEKPGGNGSGPDGRGGARVCAPLDTRAPRLRGR